MPKSLASTSLCRRHRRSRHYNLCNMVALMGQQQQLNHGAVPTTRIVSEEDMMTHDLSSIVLNDDSNHSSVIASCRSDESMDDDYSGNHHSRIISPCASLCKTEAASTVAAATTTTENPSSAKQVTPNLSSVNSRSSGTFLRRPSTSVCLVDLGGACTDADDAATESSHNDVSYRSRACSMDSTETMPSPTKASSAASPWGYFVDMQIPEDDEVLHSYNCMTTTSRRSTSPSSSPFLQVPSISPQNCYYSLHSWKSTSSSGSPNDPYPRRNVAQSKHNSNRIPLSFSKRFLETKNQAAGNDKEDRESILEGFILLNPELDETAHRLSSLSF